MSDVYKKLAEVTLAGRASVLCILTETKGSTPRKAGSKMLVLDDGKIVGTIGGGSIEQRAQKAAMKLMGCANPEKLSFDLKDDLNMSCGGFAEVYLEPQNPKPRLVIFGAGHVGKALAEIACKYGFSITLVDMREEALNEISVEGAEKILGEYVEKATEIETDNKTFVTILTPKHISDEDVLAVMAKKTHLYLGMIGSKKKIASCKARFLKEKILTQNELDAIDMPIGIRFAAETPEEIAISILARLIDVKNTSLQ